MAKNKICRVCGTAYAYCPTCPRDASKPAWMNRFDKEPCKKIWDILVANGSGDLSDADARKQLEAVNYKSVVIKNENIKSHIEKLFGTKSAPTYSKEEIKEAVTKKEETPKEEKKVESTVAAVNKPQYSLQEAMAVSHENKDKNHKKGFFQKNN